MNSLIRQVGLLQLRSHQSSHLLQRLYHFKYGNTNLYKRKPKVKTLHFKKAELLSVLKPKIPDPAEGKPMWETCAKVLNPKVDDPPLTQYETYLVKELSSNLNQSQFIAVAHCNPISLIDRKRCMVYLGRKQMFTKMYSKRVLRSGLSNTEYENLLPLFEGSTCLVFCKNPTIKDMLSIFKKYPQYVVLGGFLEGRLLSRSHIEACANFPSLDIARAQLVRVLNSASTLLLRTLGTSQSLLVSHLESRAEELKKDGATSSVSNETGGKITPLEGQEVGL